MSKIRVMIVDDHPVVREGLQQLMELDGAVEVVGKADSGLACLEMVDELSPDIVFMDIKMPGVSGLEATRLLCARHPHIKVIVLTIYDDEQYVAEAIQAGARGYVLKDVTSDELIDIIHRVHQEKAFLDPGITDKVLDSIKGGPTEKAGLTRRELEVLQGMIDGLTDRSIAETLCISGHTVRTHTKNIYRKLDVSSKPQAVARALQQGIIS